MTCLKIHKTFLDESESSNYDSPADWNEATIRDCQYYLVEGFHHGCKALQLAYQTRVRESDWCAKLSLTLSTAIETWVGMFPLILPSLLVGQINPLVLELAGRHRRIALDQHTAVMRADLMLFMATKLFDSGVMAWSMAVSEDSDDEDDEDDDDDGDDGAGNSSNENADDFDDADDDADEAVEGANLVKKYPQIEVSSKSSSSSSSLSLSQPTSSSATGIPPLCPLCRNRRLHFGSCGHIGRIPPAWMLHFFGNAKHVIVCGGCTIKCQAMSCIRKAYASNVYESTQRKDPKLKRDFEIFLRVFDGTKDGLLGMTRKEWLCQIRIYQANLIHRLADIGAK
jgi:hypothetical protein